MLMQYFNKSILYQSQEVLCKYKQKTYINKKRGSVKTKPPGVIKNSLWLWSATKLQYLYFLKNRFTKKFCVIKIIFVIFVSVIKNFIQMKILNQVLSEIEQSIEDYGNYYAVQRFKDDSGFDVEGDRDTLVVIFYNSKDEIVDEKKYSNILRAIDQTIENAYNNIDMMQSDYLYEAYMDNAFEFQRELKWNQTYFRK